MICPVDVAQDRAMAALLGGALGDAAGMPSQTLSRAEIAARHGRINDLIAPYSGHPVSHGLRAGQITDDTEQTLLLARRLIADAPGFDQIAWAHDLLNWEAGIAARGLRDLLGPSTKRALERLLAGVPPDQTGLQGTTNGAAMRIGPVGIATPPGDPAAMAARVATVSRVTHATAEAIAAASAVAMVISCGVAGMSFERAIPPALAAARAGAALGAQTGARDMAGRIALALRLADGGDAVALADGIGTSVASSASVAAAFGVVRLAAGDPWTAALIAANLGDDTDTIGAIACGMAAACAGRAALPQDKVALVLSVNRLDLAPLVADLVAMRRAVGMQRAS